MVTAFRSSGAGLPLAMWNWTDAWRGTPPVKANAAITVFTAPGARSPSVQGMAPVQSSSVETSRSAASGCTSRTTPVAGVVPRFATWTMNLGGCPPLKSYPSVVAPMLRPMGGDQPTSSSAAGVRSRFRGRLGLMVGIIRSGGEALESQWPTLDPSE